MCFYPSIAIKQHFAHQLLLLNVGHLVGQTLLGNPIKFYIVRVQGANQEYETKPWTIYGKLFTRLYHGNEAYIHANAQ